LTHVVRSCLIAIALTALTHVLALMEHLANVLLHLLDVGSTIHESGTLTDGRQVYRHDVVAQVGEAALYIIVDCGLGEGGRKEDNGGLVGCGALRVSCRTCEEGEESREAEEK
jgi:hypothetical protein